MTLIPTPPVARLLESLKHRDVREKGTYWIARCPAHEDDKHSLSIAVGKKDGRAVVKCHAGCDVEAIARGAGLTVVDLFPETTRTAGALALAPDPKARGYLAKTYDYVDEQESLLYQVCRYEPKGFSQRRPDGNGNWINGLGDVRRVLYNLPNVIQSVAENRTIYLVEGEKDADTLNALGYCATTWAAGASAWKDEYAKYLNGAVVVCLPDNDEPGRQAMQQAAAAITAHNGVAKIVDLPNQFAKGDVTDWLNAEHSLDEFGALEGAASVWCLDPSKRTRWKLRELWATESIMRPPPVVVPRLAWRSRSTLLAAAEKSGKSTLAGYVAAQVSRGGLFLDGRCAKGSVLILGLEEFIGEVAQRLQRFDADPDLVEVVDRFVDDPRERVKEARAHIEAVKPSLVIIDTLMAYAEGLVEDATKSSQMQPIVQQITRLAHEGEYAIILTHHARRADGRYRDSSAIGGGVDVIAEVFVPSEDTDPTLRRMRARGRVPAHGFDFRFEDGTYRLALGSEAPLELRIVEFVRDHPGCSANDVADDVKGNRQKALRTITALITGRHLIEASEGKGRRLLVPSSVTGSLIN